MRRVCTVIACSIVLQGVFASHATAWWDGVEHMSGPGPFYGWDISLRLFCIVESTVLPEAADKDGKKGDAKDGKKDPQKAVNTGDQKLRFVVPPPIGIIMSTCKAEGDEPQDKPIMRTRRRAAFDIGARFVWAVDNPDFANGERISLTTLEPSVSVPLFTKYNKGDVLDLGFGAGVYWISSTEFQSFHGAFLEPVRLDVHAPYVWRKHTWSAAIPRARFGLLVFPSGFERAAFAPRVTTPARISRDWVKTVAIDFDLEPLLKKWN
jgi:hypothetical protein